MFHLFGPPSRRREVREGPRFKRRILGYHAQNPADALPIDMGFPVLVTDDGSWSCRAFWDGWALSGIHATHIPSCPSWRPGRKYRGVSCMCSYYMAMKEHAGDRIETRSVHD